MKKVKIILVLLVLASGLGLGQYMDVFDVSNMSQWLKTSLFSGDKGGIEVDNDNGLVAYYKMQNEGGTVYDYSANSNDSTSITGTTNAGGKIGAAMYFDGSSDYVTIPSVSSTARTQAGWFNFTELAQDKGGGFNHLFDNAFQHSANNYIYFQGTADLFYWTPSADTWYHLAITFTDNTDSSTAKLYVNGVQYNITQQASAHDIDAVTTISKNSSISAFYGLIDEVRIYDTALSAEEVADLYREGVSTINTSTLNKGLIGHWELDEKSETTGTNLMGDFNFTSDWTPQLNGSVTDSDTFATDGNGAGGIALDVGIVEDKRYFIHFAGTATDSDVDEYGNIGVYGNGASGTALGNQTETFDATNTFTATATMAASIYPRLAGDDQSVDVTAFEIYELKTADSTPNINHGSLYQDATIFTTDQHGQSNGAMEFNNTSDYISVPHSSNLDVSGGSFTVSSWVKTSDTSFTLVSKIKTGSPYDGFRLGTSSATDGKLRLWIDDQDSTSSSAINDDQWHHITATYANGGAYVIYIDGESDVSGTHSNTAVDDSGIELRIGRENAVDRFLNGSMSDVRFYNRVLTPTEVATLYNAYKPKVSTGDINKGLIGHWPLTTKYEDSTTILDATPYGNDGTATSVTVGGRSSLFNGTTSEIDTGTDAIGTGADSFAAWIYPEDFGENSAGAILYNSSAVGNGVVFRLSGASSRLQFSSNGLSNSAVSANDSVNLNTWQHIAVTRDTNGTVAFYVDGVDATNTTTSGTPVAGLSNLYIGNSPSGDRTFDGQIADLRIYERVLTTTEIKSIYDKGRPIAAPRAAEFDGSTQYLSLADSGSVGSAEDFDMGTDDFATEFWMKTSNDFSAGAAYPVSKNAGGGAAGWGYLIYTGNTLRSEIYPSGGSRKVSISNSAVNDNAWHHIFSTVDRDGSLKLYVDGVLQDDVEDISTESALSLFTTNPLSIAAYRDGTAKYTGQLDAIRIYNFGAGGMPTGIADYISHNSKSMRVIHPSIQSYLVDGWNLDGDTFAIKESGHDLTNNGSTPFVKVR